MKKSKIFISIFCLILIMTTITAFASTTLMTYHGWEIRGKFSVNEFVLKDSDFVVVHENVKWNNVSSAKQEMEVQAFRKAWGGYLKKQATKTTYGVGTTRLKFTGLDKGTYKLYFHAPHSPACAEIKGEVID